MLNSISYYILSIYYQVYFINFRSGNIELHFDYSVNKVTPEYSNYLWVLDIQLEGTNSIYYSIAKSLVYLVTVLLMVAFYTIGERKLMGAMQRRRGPDVNGMFGMLQPFLDGLKLLIKETVFPQKANKFYFIIGPSIFLILALSVWSVIPFHVDFFIANNRNSVLVYLTFASLSVYGIILSGWASNSKYALLGGMRAVAQMISYELALTISLLIILLYSQTFNFLQIVRRQLESVWNIYFFLPVFVIFFICVLAETNRSPFDLPEAEAELVAGYNIEYAAIGFAMFFLGEYSNILASSYLTTYLFLGGGGKIFITLVIILIKVNWFLMLFILIRASVPRYRFDQLLGLGWKTLLPISFWLLLCYFSIFITFAVN